MSTVSFLAQLDAGILWILFFYKKRQFVLWTQLIQFRNWNQCAIWWKWGKKFCSQGKNNICKLILKSIFLSLIIVSIHNQWNNIANQPVINNQFVCPLVESKTSFPCKGLSNFGPFLRVQHLSPDVNHCICQVLT